MFKKGKSKTSHRKSDEKGESECFKSESLVFQKGTPIMLWPLYNMLTIGVIVMSVSRFMHYDPFKNVNIFQFSSVQCFFLQKCGFSPKVNCREHLNGSKKYQKIVGCGLMDQNNYLIGSVGFMLWNSWPNITTTCIEIMQLKLKYNYSYPHL